MDLNRVPQITSAAEALVLEKSESVDGFTYLALQDAVEIITPLLARIADLEAERDKYKEAFNAAVVLAKSMKENFKFYKGEFTVQSNSWMSDKVSEILKTEQALVNREAGK